MPDKELQRSDYEYIDGGFLDPLHKCQKGKNSNPVRSVLGRGEALGRLVQTRPLVRMMDAGRILGLAKRELQDSIAPDLALLRKNASDLRTRLAAHDGHSSRVLHENASRYSS